MLRHSSACIVFSIRTDSHLRVAGWGYALGGVAKEEKMIFFHSDNFEKYQNVLVSVKASKVSLHFLAVNSTLSEPRM